MTTPSRSTIGLAVFVLLALVDIFWIVLAWSGQLSSADAPPSGALVIFVVVGAVTLGTVRPAQRGNRTAAWIMVGSRVVSVLLIDLPAILFGAPGWVIAIAWVAMLLAALGIWCTAPLLSRTHAASASVRTAS